MRFVSNWKQVFKSYSFLGNVFIAFAMGVAGGFSSDGTFYWSMAVANGAVAFGRMLWQGGISDGD